MMWQLNNWLFGWHYVYLDYSSYGLIRRIRFIKSGRPYLVTGQDGLLLFLDHKYAHISALTFDDTVLESWQKKGPTND